MNLKAHRYLASELFEQYGVRGFVVFFYRTSKCNTSCICILYTHIHIYIYYILCYGKMISNITIIAPKQAKVIALSATLSHH